MHTFPISYDLALFLTQITAALAIVVLAIAANATRKQVEQRLRTLEVHALRATVRHRPPAHSDQALER
jgi:hypothetical protein